MPAATVRYTADLSLLTYPNYVPKAFRMESAQPRLYIHATGRYIALEKTKGDGQFCILLKL